MSCLQHQHSGVRRHDSRTTRPRRRSGDTGATKSKMPVCAEVPSTMTLEDIAASLPNGFHDALLRTLTVDYVSRRATLNLRVWVGDVDARREADREAYRAVTLTISGLLWWIVESPQNVTGATGEELWIDAGPLSSLQTKPDVPSVSDDAFAWWIFVRQWNAFMYIAGSDASLDS
jgi:hypothetical protein